MFSQGVTRLSAEILHMLTLLLQVQDCLCVCVCVCVCVNVYNAVLTYKTIQQ